MATTRSVARARSDVAAAADEVQRARAAGPGRGRSSSSEPRAADRSPPRRMPTRSLAAGLSLAPAADDDDDGEQKAAADDEDDEGVQAEVDAFAEHGIDESNSESDDEQLARSMATVDLGDEPDDGKAERKSSSAAVSGSVAAAQHSRKRRRKPEVVQPVTSPHQLDWYKGCEGYACDICGDQLGDAWMCSGHGGECVYGECVPCHDEKKGGAAAAADAQWTETLTATRPLAFTGPAPGPHGVHTVDPLALFRLIVTDAVMDAIVTATNRYASHKYSDSKVLATYSMQHTLVDCASCAERKTNESTWLTRFFFLCRSACILAFSTPTHDATELHTSIRYLCARDSLIQCCVR